MCPADWIEGYNRCMYTDKVFVKKWMSDAKY